MTTTLSGLPAVALRPSCTAQTWLTDGTPVRIRPIRGSDLELERRFVYGLSARTRYLRLLSGRQLQPGELERWTNIDPAREITLIALLTEGDAEREIAVARCAFDERDPPRWDFGLVVGDAWQGQGLGEAMLQRLMQCAEESGIAALSSITLSENRRMLSLARRLGFSIRREVGDATLMRIEKALRS